MTYDIVHRPAYQPDATLAPLGVETDYNTALLNTLTYADTHGLIMAPLDTRSCVALRGCLQGWALYDGEINAAHKVGFIGIAQGETVLGEEVQKSGTEPITTV